MPGANIERAIKKGTGELEGESYEELTFEGYGPSGVAIIVEALTDNKNRTASFIRSTFDKNGGNLGTPGCVSYMFSRKGVILVEKTDDIDEDEIMMAALDAGAEDMKVEDDAFEILCDPGDLKAVTDGVKEAGYEVAQSEVEFVASIDASVAPDDMKSLRKLIDTLEDNDDVQKVAFNCDLPEEE